MRCGIVLLLVLAIVVAPSLSTARGLVDDRDNVVCEKAYNKAAESRLDGIVEAIGSEPSGAGYCVYVRLVHRDERFKVFLGPRTFVTRIGFMPTLGDKIVVTGAPIGRAGKVDFSGLRLIEKGTFQHVVEICNQLPDGTLLDTAQLAELTQRYADWSRQGVRVIAAAARSMEETASLQGRGAERDMVFSGFVTFLDRPKDGVDRAISDLRRLGVSVKVITGDNKLVAQHVARLVGMRADRVLTGSELDELHDEALWHAAERTDLFAEVDPKTKERLNDT